MSTIIDKMERNAKRYRERIEEIRRDWTRSEEAKRQDLEAAYSEARSTYAQLAEEYRTGIHDKLQQTRKAAFSAPRLSKDEALDAFIYRDALDRASKTRDQRDLSEMLARAEMTGDAPLARAVLYRGYELQNEHLVWSYFEKYPDELPTWDAFTQAATEFNTVEAMGVSGVAGVPNRIGRESWASSSPTLRHNPQAERESSRHARWECGNRKARRGGHGPAPAPTFSTRGRGVGS